MAFLCRQSATAPAKYRTSGTTTINNRSTSFPCAGSNQDARRRLDKSSAHRARTTPAATIPESMAGIFFAIPLSDHARPFRWSSASSCRAREYRHKAVVLPKAQSVADQSFSTKSISRTMALPQLRASGEECLMTTSSITIASFRIVSIIPSLDGERLAVDGAPPTSVAVPSPRAHHPVPTGTCDEAACLARLSPSGFQAA